MPQPPAPHESPPAATPRSLPAAAGMKPGPPRYSAPPRRGRNRVEVPDQDHRPCHPRCAASRCQDRPLEQHLRGRLLRGQFPAISTPCRHRNPMPLARREQPPLHPRCHFPGRSVPHPSQPRCLCQAALLRIQHPASQSDFNLQPGSLRCRSRRSRTTPQVELQLRALNSPGGPSLAACRIVDSQRNVALSLLNSAPEVLNKALDIVSQIDAANTTRLIPAMNEEAAPSIRVRCRVRMNRDPELPPACFHSDQPINDASLPYLAGGDPIPPLRDWARILLGLSFNTIDKLTAQGCARNGWIF